MKRAIIFGVTGQDGSHLADLLLAKDYNVTGVMRRSSTDTSSRIKQNLRNPKFRLIEGDITDTSSVMNVLISNENVDEVYNLAAQSHVGTSFKQPAITWDITGKGCINILQAIVDLGIRTRFYQASSSEMFGSSYVVGADGNKYQDENTKFLPQSPYAISKCAAHYAVRLFREAYNLHASAGILFNHEGPRRGDNFVTKKITNWVADFRQWIIQWDLNPYNLYTKDLMLYSNDREVSDPMPVLRLGNLDSYRDWGYAGDYVEAMWLMLQQQYPDDYVICTGQTYKVKDFLDYAFKYIGISDWSKFVYVDPEFYRPAEVDYLRGDCSKAKTVLGWTPKHDLDSLVSLMIESRLNEKLQNNDRYI
jgi:GDPmannose 4,6-dehydratase